MHIRCAGSVNPDNNEENCMRVLMATALLASLGACTWVKPTEAGKQVVVAQDFNVTSCRKLGTTTTTVKDKVGVFGRNVEKVEKELNMLAQDEAAGMGGDTIVPKGDVKDGSRAYDVYRCKSS
jgi:hypothetical protein